MLTLRETFDPRRNSLDVMRLVLALLVVVSHGLVMQTGSQPYWGESTLGDFAVDGFFVLSGFLITRSYLQIQSFWRYAWHRFLRIMPGFWVCLLLTAFVVAPVVAVLEGLPITTPFTEAPSSFRYVLANAGLLMTQYGIGGLLSSSPTPAIFDGALWTLILEALCYVVLAVLGVVGVLKRYPISVPIMAATLWVLNVLDELGLDLFIGDSTLRMTFVFFLGATAYLYAHRIPMNGWLGMASAAATLLTIIFIDDYRMLGAVPFTYLLCWVGTCFPWPVRVRADLSYGTYIYHWPLLQVMALTALLRLPSVLFIGVGMVLVLGVAWASWTLVEKPALARKHMSPPRLLKRRVWNR